MAIITHSIFMLYKTTTILTSPRVPLDMCESQKDVIHVTFSSSLVCLFTSSFSSSSSSAADISHPFHFANSRVDESVPNTTTTKIDVGK